MKYACNNPALRYLQERQWKWVSIYDLLKGTALPLPTVLSLVNRPENNRFIDTRNICGTAEYRFIGQKSAIRRRIAEYTRNRYPEWVNSAQVAKAVGFGIAKVGHILGCEMNLLPIEHRKGFRQQNEYRYVPDDTRSLAEGSRIPKRPRKNYIRNRELYEIRMKIAGYLKLHTGEWFSSAQLCNALGLTIAPQSIGTMLYHYSQKHCEIRMIKNGHLWQYAWIPAEAETAVA